MKKKLLFIGDSLVEYFDWASRFPSYSVSNLGIAGETVDGLYARLDRVIMTTDTPDMVFIMSGINNLAMEDRGFGQKYRNILQRLRQEYPDAEIVAHSLLPVLYPFIGNRDIEQMNLTLKQIASDEGARYLDIHARFLDEDAQPDPSCLVEDGVHVSEEGYRRWADEIEKILFNR
ncbi:MAG: GDSL family lipase [Nitrospirae bacterium]|nr:GDSL family lipase [Nitrospirota bacterium]